jgi:hypothetical protein
LRTAAVYFRLAPITPPAGSDCQHHQRCRGVCSEGCDDVHSDLFEVAGEPAEAGLVKNLP